MPVIDAAFALTKEVARIPQRADLRQLIHQLNEVPGTDDSFEDRSQFGYLARQLGAQFYGYLLVDSQHETTELPFQIPSLAEGERSLLVRGHTFVVSLLDGILEGIPAIFKKALDPYSVYRELEVSSDVPAFDVSAEARSALLDAFTGHRAMDGIHSMRNLLPAQWTADSLHNAVVSIIQRIGEEGVLDFPNDLKHYVLVKPGNPQYRPLRLLLSLVCLRISLKNLVQMMFQKFADDRLIMLDSNVIFNYRTGSTVAGTGHQVDCQELILVETGDLVLLRDPHHPESSLELCRIEGNTMQFSRDLGTASTLLMRTVDKDLNSFSLLLQ